MNLKNFLAVATTALCVVACSSDDEPSQSSEFYKAVTGSYTVYTSASVMGTAVVTNEEKVEIVSDASNSFATLRYSGVWGEGQTSKLDVTRENGRYVVNGAGKIAASMGDNTHAGTYDFTVEGTVSEDKSDASLTFSIVLGGMGTVTVTSASGYAPATLFLPDTYAGYTSAVFAYSSTPMVTADETVSVTANENGTVNVVLASSTWGESTISNIAVEVKDGVYTLKGEGTAAMSMGGGTPKEYPCTLEGTVSGDKEDVEMAFTLSIMGGTTITFHQGDAPAAALLAGSYKGYTSAVFAYSPTPMVTADETMSVTANEDGTLNVILDSSAWGKSTISNVSAVKENGVYTLKGEGVSVMSMGGGTPKEYPCTLEGTVSGDKEDVEMAFTLSIMGGTTITFRQGDALEVLE